MAKTKLYTSSLTILRKYLREKKMRPTAERNMVLEQACQLPQPFTAEQLISACAPEHISIGTIYNSLNLFLEAQVLRAMERLRGRTVTEYEVMVGNSMRMMIVCSKCGRKTAFHDKAVARLIQEHKFANLKVAQVLLYVYGECKVCRRKQKKEL